MKILCVDDEKKFLMLLEYFFKQEENFSDCQFFWGESAEEARGLLHEKGPFDIVITDYHMPGEDGLSLTSFIRRFSPQTHLIILSSYENIMEKAQELCDTFWTKPVDLEKLGSYIREVQSQKTLQFS